MESSIHLSTEIMENEKQNSKDGLLQICGTQFSTEVVESVPFNATV